MNGRRFVASLPLAALLLASCGLSGFDEQFEPTGPVAVTDETRNAARSSNAVAFDLYGRLKKAEGNLFFSPAGVSTALAMAFAGADGETKAEMATVLHLDGSDDAVHTGFGTLTEVLNSGTYGYRMRAANRLFGAGGDPFRPAFVGLLRRRYRAEPVPLDFAAPGDARDEINDWVSERTNGRIADLIGPRVLTPETRLILANAVHFKGRWADDFHPEQTKDAPFRLRGGGEANVPLMHQTGRFRYAEADGLQIVELPYVDSQISMLVVLPDEVGLDGLEPLLTAEAVGGWIEKLADREVDLFLPRFATSSSFSLAETLSAAGMPLAFDRERADFSGMTSGREPLFLSAVVHEAFIMVDEEGTEAAAATAMTEDVASEMAEETPEPVVFRADRPFAYLIRHDETGAILFLGRLTHPAR